MMADIEKYAYLWDGAQEGWSLLVAPDLESGFCIFNVLTSDLLHIDDEQLNSLLCERMKVADCRIIDSLPEAGVAVNVKPM
jgi:hypothetical protein